MTITTPRTNGRPTLPARRTRAAFTLSEVMISATLSALILAGVLSAFVMMGRSGFLASSYSEAQNQTRRALDIFGEDARKAADIRWNSAQSVTLSVVGAGSTVSTVTYAYDADSTSPHYRCFYRKLGDGVSTATPLVLLREVASDFAFQRYKLENASGAVNTAASDLETKQIQLTFRVARSSTVTPTATQAATSARYILRNKRVSN